MEKLHFITVSGKWQRRLVITLSEAGGACTVRQLRIRCGMHQDKYGTLMRMCIYRLVEKGMVSRVRYGLYKLGEID